LIAKNKIEDAAKRIENDKNRLEWLLKEKKDFLNNTVKRLEDIVDESGKKIRPTFLFFLPNPPL